MGDETAAGGGRAFFLGRIVGARRARGSRVEPLDARWARASGLISAWRSVNVVADASRSMTSLASDDAMSLDPTRATVEVTLLTPTRGSVGGERTLAVDRLERDPTKRERAIRAWFGAARRSTRAPARRSRIAPASFPAPSLGEDARIPARARGASHPGRRAHPAPHDPPPRRSPARAAARIPPPRRRRRPAPLRGRPRARPPPRTHAIRAPDGRRERHRGIPLPVLVTSNAIAYRILDAAFTADGHLSTRGRAIFAAVGDVAAVAARDALIVPPPAPRAVDPRDVGTSPLFCGAKRSRVRSETAGETRLRLARGKTMRGAAPRLRLDTRARTGPMRVASHSRSRTRGGETRLAAETAAPGSSELRSAIPAARARGRGRGRGRIRIRDRHPRARGRRVALRPRIQGADPRPRHPRARRRSRWSGRSRFGRSRRR